MTKKKFKWIIQELKNSKQLKKTADKILLNRIDSLLKYSFSYLEYQTVESLHDVRIALRRVRYSMELFFNCYDEKIFLRFYKDIQDLQDSSGSVRDLDISIGNINNTIQESEIDFKNEVIKKLNLNKIFLEEEFQKKLKKFVKGKSLKEFYKQIK